MPVEVPNALSEALSRAVEITCLLFQKSFLIMQVLMEPYEHVRIVYKEWK